MNRLPIDRWECSNRRVVTRRCRWDVRLLGGLMVFVWSLSEAEPLEAFWRAHRVEHYQAPSPAQLNAAERLFERTMANAPVVALTNDWAQLGFALEPRRDVHGAFFLVSETRERREGRGVFALRPSSERRVVLQVPHGYSDLHTGAIGWRWFESGRVSAIAVNSAPRRIDIDGVRVSTDMAHRAESYLVPFTRGLMAYRTDTVFVQLHGFAAEKRRSDAGRSAALILSAGTQHPTALALEPIECLRGSLGASARLYPRDVDELGGTKNIAGRLILATGRVGFLHLEMALPTRQRLLADARFERLFMECLL